VVSCEAPLVEGFSRHNAESVDISTTCRGLGEGFEAEMLGGVVYGLFDWVVAVREDSGTKARGRTPLVT